MRQNAAAFEISDGKVTFQLKNPNKLSQKNTMSRVMGQVATASNNGDLLKSRLSDHSL